MYASMMQPSSDCSSVASSDGDTLITVKLLRLSGEAMQVRQFPRSDTSVSLGHIFGIAKGHLNVSEDEVRLVIGHAEFDSSYCLSKLFLLKAVQHSIVDDVPAIPTVFVVF